MTQGARDGDGPSIGRCTRESCTQTIRDEHPMGSCATARHRYRASIALIEAGAGFSGGTADQLNSALQLQPGAGVTQRLRRTCAHDPSTVSARHRRRPACALRRFARPIVAHISTLDSRRARVLDRHSLAAAQLGEHHFGEAQDWSATRPRRACLHLPCSMTLISWSWPTSAHRLRGAIFGRDSQGTRTQTTMDRFTAAKDGGDDT